MKKKNWLNTLKAQLISMNTSIFSQTVKKDSIHFEKQSTDSWLEFLLEDRMARKSFLILRMRVNRECQRVFEGLAE